MMSIVAELRRSFRSLVHRPGYTASAVLTLALGIAATTVIFSTFHHLVMAPLPFERWDELWHVMRARDDGRIATSPPAELLRLARSEARTLRGIEAWQDTERTLTGEGEPVILAGAEITSGLPGLLGMRPLLGRTFTADESGGGPHVVLIGETLWRARFGGEREVIGRTIQLNQVGHTIVGVMPATFARYQTHGDRHEIWLPLDLEADAFGVSALARLAPGASAEQAEAELARIAESVPAPRGMGDEWRYSLRNIADVVHAGFNARRVLPPLFGAAGLLLLISCANVAGLMLMRLQTRRRELAVRSALGGDRPRLFGALIGEQLVIAAAAGTLGVLLAVWGVELVRLVRPAQLAALDNLSVNGTVLLFAALLTVATTFAFGVLPGMTALRRTDSPFQSLASGVRSTDSGRTRAALVTLQLAVSTLLLVGGFLLVRTVHGLQQVDLGFDRSNTLVAQIPLPEHRFDAEARRALLTSVAEALRSVPDVASLSVATSAPPRLGLVFVQRLEVEGSDVSTEGISFLSGAGITPGFFETIGARMLIGRDLSESDDAHAVVVTRAFVEHFWAGDTGVGRRFRTASGAPWQTIVGVVENIRQEGPVHSIGDMKMFWPMPYGSPSAALLARTSGDPLRIAPMLREIVARHDALLAIRELETMDRRMAATIATQRFNMTVLLSFALAAAVLCGIGLYGLVSYSLQQRVREVGIRIALGATPLAVRRIFLSQAARLAAVGVAIGLLGALATGRITEALVHGVSPRDPLAFGAALGVIGVIVVVAAWLPARRAARVDPLAALRDY